jgi:hypothetical protein
MLKLSYRNAFLISLPTLIPFILFWFDFFSPKNETSGIIMEKRIDNVKGTTYKVYLTKIGIVNLSKKDYSLIYIGDSVIIKAGKTLNIVDEFYDITENKTIKTTDSIYAFLTTLLLSLSVVIVFYSLVKEPNNLFFSDSQYIVAYWLFIFVCYLTYLIYICVQVSPHQQ